MPRSIQRAADATATRRKQVIVPRAARRYAPPRRTQFDSEADLRPSADGSAVRTSLVAGQLQAASVPRLGQTDRRTDRGIA